MSSYLIPAQFLILYSRIELDPYSESLGIWMLFAFSLLYMSFGIYQFIQGYWNRKTRRFEQKRAEKLEELDRAIEHYRVLVNNSNDIIYRTDLKGMLTYINPVAVETMGYPEEELLGKHSLELVRPDYRQKAELFYTNLILARAETSQIKFPVVTKSGEEVWLDQSVQLLKKDDDVVGIQAVARDVTDLRSTERKLKSKEDLFHQFIKNTPAAVAMLDREMCYLAVSDRWIEDFEIEDEELVGTSYYESIPDIPDEWEEIYRSCLTGVSYKSEEEPFPRADGTVDWLQWEVHPWYEASGEVGGLIVFKELITARKQAEETLLKRKEMAEDASRTKSNFIGRMSHEFRTPLTSILGFAQMLEIDSSLSQGQLNQIEQIKNSGEYLLEIINDLLALSHIETGKIKFEGQDINLRQLMNEIAAGHSARYPDNDNRLHLEIESSVPEILYTDADKLREILGNLIDNAFKFTYDGKITVTADITPVEDTGADGLLSVTVSDTGSGIPADKLETIFQPFTQGKETYNQGTGLGLALAYKFCRFLGGTLQAESELGKGSSFTVKIPVRISGENGWTESEKVVKKIKSEEPDNVTPAEVGNFIRSLDKEAQERIHQALQIQDLETISTIDNEIELPADKGNGALDKLKSSARNNDYLFITLVNRELEAS